MFKFYILFIFLLVTRTSVLSQKWQATFDNVYSHSPGKIIKSEDNGYYLCGANNKSGVFYSVGFIAKLDEFCNTEWKKEMGNGVLEGSSVSDIIQLPNFDLIALGNFASSVSLVKLNSNGGYITSKGLMGVSRSVMILSGDGNILIASGNLYKLNPLLNTLWYKSIGYDTFSVSYTSIDTLANGDLICGGFASSTNGYIKKCAVTRFNSLGDTIWNKYFENKSFTQVNDLIVLPDDTFIALSDCTLETDSLFYLTKFDDNGLLLWNKIISLSETQDSNGDKLIKKGTDVFIAGKFYDKNSLNYKMFMINADSSLQIEWSRRYGDLKDEYFRDMILDYDDNPLLISREGDYLSQKTILMVKTDSIGQSGCRDSLLNFQVRDSIISVYTKQGYYQSFSPLIGGSLPVSNGALSIDVKCSDIDLSIEEVQIYELSFLVYPNPSMGKFNLENKARIHSDLEIKVYNLFGEILISTLFNHDKTEIDLTSFSSGIYFITVTNDDGVLWKSKVVKE